MIVRTRKYKLPLSTYMQLGVSNVIREQWWVFLIALALMSGTFFVKTIWFILGAILGLALYFLFWVIQFYGVPQLESNRVIFERLDYEIGGRQIMARINSKQGMPIPWEQVKRAAQKQNGFLLIISKAHIIYWPYKIFNNANDIKFVETILKRKGLLKHESQKIHSNISRLFGA